MIDPSTQTWLVGIRQEIASIRDITRDPTFDNMDTWAMKRALQHSLLIIAEASRQIPPTLEAKRPDLPWAQIHKLDNMLARELDPPDLSPNTSGVPWSQISDHLDDLDEAAAAWLEDAGAR